MKKNIFNLFVIALISLMFVQCKNTTTAVAGTSNVKIGYVSIDSLLSNYTVYKKYSQDFLAERQKSEAKLGAKMQSLQKEANDFQVKMKKGFYSRKQAESIQQELMQKQQNLQQLQSSLGAQLQEKQFKMRNEIMEKINTILTKYSKKHNFDFILNKPLFAKESYNVTKDITKLLNESK